MKLSESGQGDSMHESPCYRQNNRRNTGETSMPKSPHFARSANDFVRKFLVTCLLSCALLAWASRASAQALSEGTGWTWYERFEGTSDSIGVVTELDSTLGYNFNKYFAADAGFPVYFIHASDLASGTSSANGIGDMYVDLRFTLTNPVVNFSSSIRGTAPTGDQAEGLSTGHAAYDWSNYFDHHFGRVRPYLVLGVANTVSDTIYYVRPFSSFGVVGHFEGGLGFRVSRYLSLTASAYDIAPSGEQTIYSRVVARQATASASAAWATSGPRTSKGAGTMQGGTAAGMAAGSATGNQGRFYETTAITTGSASLASDNGFSAGATIFPTRFVDLDAGISRSMHFAENSVYFGIGFDVKRMWKSVR
jgi:hypothetical protein